MNTLISILTKVRKRINLKKKIALSEFAIMFLIAVASGYFIDSLLPWNWFTNTIRALFAVGVGATLFLFWYSLVIYFRPSIFNVFRELREDLTITQRINTALLVGIVSIIFHIIIIKPETTGYIFYTGVLLAWWLYLFYWVRPTYDDVNFTKLGIEDFRDKKHEMMVEELDKQRKLEKEEKKKAKEKKK